MFHTISADLIGKLTYYPLYAKRVLDYRKYSRVNKGFNYILCVIDCFSRYVWAEPLRTKTLAESAAAFNKILSNMDIVPRVFK